MASPKLFRKIFIANRGEVAVRIANTCDALGITPVFAASTADVHAHYLEGREKVLLGPSRASESYLNFENVIQGAKQKGCTAIHPGWGFLAENHRFAAMCETHGLTFIGPPAHVMRLMGTKSPAKKAMKRGGLTLIPGSDGVLPDVKAAKEVAKEIGYPVLIKAEAGGGGRGMRIAASDKEIESAFDDASAEALAAFGDGRVYLEKLIEGGRHIEIQLMADKYGNAVHIGERDCTVQRNHQKLIEESPAPTLSDAERKKALEAAVQSTIAIGYVGAGTMEFLMDHEGTLRFMEMNTRLQVEHSVSEIRSGLDLVAEQIRVAAGLPLSWKQEDITLDGHAIECRINAEDPTEGFKPSPGKIENWSPPKEVNGELRVDTHACTGYVVPPQYDSLIAKVITKGADRNKTIKKMIDALEGFDVGGIKTTISFHRKVLGNDDFKSNNYHTGSIPGQ